MSINRVQKLLLSEYCDFEDLVLIESPFAQTTKEGNGIRQVHLGLTPSKLILATDILPPVNPENVEYKPGLDPEIETFELIAIYPVECINLSIYRRKRRQAIKARFCNNRVLYFELGGFERRGMFWNLWCEKVKFLCPGDSGSSRSETSVATSTTGSSLYLVNRKIVKVNGIRQLWCKFGPNFGVDTHFINEVLASNSQSLVKKWTDRNLFLGKDLQENALDYKPLMKKPRTSEFVKSKKTFSVRRCEYPSIMEKKNLSFGDTVQVNRFGSGINEGCRTGLYLTLDDYITPTRYSSTMLQTTESNPSIDWRSTDYEEIAEVAVLIWEYYSFSKTDSIRKPKHRRRYGFVPKPLLFSGFGTHRLTKSDCYSLQVKRAVSEVCLRTGSWDKDLKLPSQLFASLSCPSLKPSKNYKIDNNIRAPKKPVAIFWTPGFSYRPMSVRETHDELQNHLKKMRSFQESHCKCRRRKHHSRRFLRKFSVCREKETDEDEDEYTDKKRRKHGFISNILAPKVEDISEWDETKHPNETPIQHLKRILKVDIKMTAWDFDSTTLAQQLTLIDKDLFLKIPTSELAILLWQQNSKNAPNISALIAFSYRISCLISSEILRDDSEKMRARLMARFINVANKCHRICNFQSCRSVLCGLQNPSIFRLRKTWAYVRKKHASKYQTFEFLCRLYRDPRMPSYQKTFFIFSQNPPFLPFIGHIIAKLLDKVPNYRIQTSQRTISRQMSFCTTSSFKSCSSVVSKISHPAEVHQNLFSKIFNIFSNTSPPHNIGDGDNCPKPKSNLKKKRNSSRCIKFKGLYEYYKPFDHYEDNREDVLLEVTELLEKCQIGAMHYNFSYNEMARNFLLKSRHFDDQDNFFISLGLETSRPSSNRNKN